MTGSDQSAPAAPTPGPSAPPAFEAQVDTSDSPPAESPARPPPTEQPARQPAQEPKGDKPDGSPAEDPESDAAAKRSRHDPQKRIGQLTRRLREAERREAYERGQREALQQFVQTQRPAAAEKDPEPKQDDFDSLDDFIEAKSDWKSRRKAAPQGEQPAAPAKEVPAQPERKASETEVKSAIEARAKYEDFDDVIADPDLPYTVHMADAVSDLPNAAEILYHLGKDEDELARIAQLSPREQARAVTRFADKLEATLKAAPSPPAKAGSESSSAPSERQAAASTLDGVPRAPTAPASPAGRAAPDVDVENMSESEYMKYMDKQEAERRRRR